MVKSGFVSVIGRPSSGKSTLINSICGHKISIVSMVPQTTRNKIRAIWTEEESQVIFLDTPGFHISEKDFNKNLNDLVKSAILEADLILYVIDLSRRPGEEELEIINFFKKNSKKPLVIFNKIDIENNFLNEFIVLINDMLKIDNVFKVSAIDKVGLDGLKAEILLNLPESPKLYPDEFYTDQQPEFRIAEIIREKAINRLDEEIPHSLYVEISDLELNKDEDLLWIRAFIVVERESQKGIVIGKGGEKLKKIRELAKREIKSCFPHKIKLNIMVKANPKWKKDKNILNKIFK